MCLSAVAWRRPVHGRQDTSGHAAGLLYEVLSGRWWPKFCALGDTDSHGCVRFQAGIRAVSWSPDVLSTWVWTFQAMVAALRVSWSDVHYVIVEAPRRRKPHLEVGAAAHSKRIPNLRFAIGMLLPFP